MWIYLKSLLMVKDRQIAKEMASDLKKDTRPLVLSWPD